MKLLFTIPGKHARLADKERMIIDLFDGHYYDLYGKQVPAEDGFAIQYTPLADIDPWERDWIRNEGIEEKLISESTIEVKEEIDDFFGLYGFKNKAGEFVIEPQYAFAHEFTFGLAAVNLNRTWYKGENGRRYYENHFGYINERGETVIPFAYDEAWPFNKNGVAVVEDRKWSYLIDTKGSIIPGTEKLFFSHFYDFDDRFIEYSYEPDNVTIEGPVGLYDTKERKILLEPIYDDFIQWSDDFILVYERNGDHGISDFAQFYINSKGEKLFPWLLNKGFAIVEKPNESSVSIVAISKYTELSGNPSSYFPHNGKKYERVFLYGIYSSKERFIVPMEYEEITDLGNNVFCCKKDGLLTFIQVEENDC